MYKEDNIFKENDLSEKDIMYKKDMVIQKIPVVSNRYRINCTLYKCLFENSYVNFTMELTVGNKSYDNATLNFYTSNRQLPLFKFNCYTNRKKMNSIKNKQLNEALGSLKCFSNKSIKYIQNNLYDIIEYVKNKVIMDKAL